MLLKLYAQAPCSVWSQRLVTQTDCNRRGTLMPGIQHYVPVTHVCNSLYSVHSVVPCILILRHIWNFTAYVLCVGNAGKHV